MPNGSLRSTLPVFPANVRLRQTLRRKLKRLAKVCLSPHAGYHQIVLLFFAMVLLCFVIFLFSSLLWSHESSFDDETDMRLLVEEDVEYVLRKQNETATDFGDPLRLLNATDVKLARISWDYIYGEIQRKALPPDTTKYKTRLLRELYARTHYAIMNKFSPALDVSCNYVNDINDTGSLFSFQCSETSHRCPDGNFSLEPVFAPKEGSSVTWNDVVIVLMVSAGREPYLEAAAETWISRIHPDATIFFARDGQEPSLPVSVMARGNTHIFEYGGDTGLDSLDVKAYMAWSEVYNKFGVKGKKYFLKTDDDAFLFGHNLVRFLGKVEHWFSGREQALYFGHPFCGHGDLEALSYATWCYAGGGAYGLSIEALQILLTQIKGGCAYFYDYVAKAPNLRPIDDRYGGRYEDVMVGRCLRQARTRTQLRGTSLIACGSFFPFAPLHYFQQFGYSKESMCKKLQGEPITIHNLEPSAIRYLDHFVFEYPLGGEITPFSPENERVQELIDVCEMKGKKMTCDLSRVSLL